MTICDTVAGGKPEALRAGDAERGAGLPAVDRLVRQVAQALVGGDRRGLSAMMPIAEGAAVPGLWSLEIANGLVMGERRGRVKPAESAAFVAMIEELPIVADRATGARALHETMSLAREHRLTAYDAAYLELAMRLGLPLATGDRSLKAAAKRVGVVLIDGTQ